MNFEDLKNLPIKGDISTIILSVENKIGEITSLVICELDSEYLCSYGGRSATGASILEAYENLKKKCIELNEWDF